MGQHFSKMFIWKILKTNLKWEECVLLKTTVLTTHHLLKAAEKLMWSSILYCNTNYPQNYLLQHKIKATTYFHGLILKSLFFFFNLKAWILWSAITQPTLCFHTWIGQKVQFSGHKFIYHIMWWHISQSVCKC